MNQKTINFRKTDAKIVNALITIGSKIPLAKITVSDITKRLKINRGTFYLHYSDKDELVESIEANLNEQVEKKLLGVMEELMAANDDPQATHPQLIGLMHFLRQNKKALIWLMGQNGDPKFIQSLSELLKRKLLEMVTEVKGELSFISTIPDDYVVQIVVSGIIDIIQFWLKEKEPLPEEDIANIIVKTRVLSPYQLLDLKD